MAGEAEWGRLDRKLATGTVRGVWLNFGGDAQALEAALARLLGRTHSAAAPAPRLYGGLYVPTVSDPELTAARAARCVLPERYATAAEMAGGSELPAGLAGPGEAAEQVLRLYAEHGVEPVVQSRVRTPEVTDANATFAHALNDVLCSVPA